MTRQRKGTLGFESESHSALSDFLWPHGLFRSDQISRSVMSDSLRPMDCSTPGLPTHHQLPEFTQTHVHWVVIPSNHLILCRPLLLLPSIFLSIRVFSNESVLHIRWAKYWSFSFNISPSNEYSGQTGWISLLSKGLSSLLQHHSSKASIITTKF